MGIYDRPVRGADVIAAARAFPGITADHDALDARIPPDAVFGSLVELGRACPPAAIGISPGAYATLFGPLFGEFE